MNEKRTMFGGEINRLNISQASTLFLQTRARKKKLDGNLSIYNVALIVCFSSCRFFTIFFIKYSPARYDERTNGPLAT